MLHVYRRFLYFNPLPPHGGRPYREGCSHGVCSISIHSLRMEGDVLLAMICTISSYFNPLPPHGGRPALMFCYCPSVRISIHSLRMEGDTCRIVRRIAVRTFQSTPSAWRETAVEVAPPEPKTFQSTPSAWRETCDYPTPLNVSVVFQSTPSAWRETLFRFFVRSRKVISIHSLRMEGDQPFQRFRSF